MMILIGMMTFSIGERENVDPKVLVNTHVDDSVIDPI